MHLPRGAGAQEIEDLLLDKLDLQRGDLTVSVHQPEPFLIRFEQSAHCDEARRRGRFNGGGIEICLRRWRSLENAFGQRLFFRVRLYLDGIPEHAWTLDIVERVIGTRCALQCINTDLVQPSDTRHIDLWAWTANPSAIPKKIWLAFTHRPSDRSTARVVVVNERWQPERWQQGVRYKVFLHVGLVEDYTAAADDLQGAVNNPGAFTPICRPYTWYYGVEDGAPASMAARYPIRLPRPPREPEVDRRDTTTPGARRDDLRRREHGGRGNDDARRDEERSNSGAPRRSSGRSCRDMDFVWPERRDGDDDYYDHPGRGGQARGRGDARHDTDPVRRERTRSPRRRDAEFRGGRRHAQEGEEARLLRGVGHACLRILAVPAPLPEMNGLEAMDVPSLHEIFKVKALELKNTLLQARGPCSDAWLQEATDYINKACGLAARMELAAPGNVAWSVAGERLIPSSLVFDRLKKATTPSVGELERALSDMELRNKAAAGGTTATTEATPAGTLLGQHSVLPNSTGPEGAGPDVADLLAPASPPAGQRVVSDGPLQQGEQAQGDPQDEQAHDGVTAGCEEGRHCPLLSEEEDVAKINDLFSTPVPAVLPSLPPRAPRQRRTFDMSAVRRSARLANKPARPSVQRAQRNLCRKLGIPADELRSIDEVLQDFISMFTGPLPESIMTAMTAIFDLDDEDAEEVNDAMLRHAGEAADDLQAEVEAHHN
ncbi:unnamed protein product [Urochloa humidicola]